MANVILNSQWDDEMKIIYTKMKRIGIILFLNAWVLVIAVCVMMSVQSFAQIGPTIQKKIYRYIYIYMLKSL